MKHNSSAAIAIVETSAPSKSPIVSLFERKSRITHAQAERIKAWGRLIEDMRSDNPRPLSQDELIARLKLEAHIRASESSGASLRKDEIQPAATVITFKKRGQ